MKCPVCKQPIVPGVFQPVQQGSATLCGRAACSARLEADRLDAELEEDRDYQQAKAAEKRGRA